MILGSIPGYRRFEMPGIGIQNCHQLLIRICFGACVFYFMGIAAICDTAHGRSSEAADLEYRIKAAFLLNFTKFVSWPEDLLDDKKSPIILCVVGENPFGAALDSLRDKTVRGRPIEVRYESNPGALPACHVAFMSHSLRGNDGEILRQLAGVPILTVGENRDFAKQGGMINFIMQNNKIRFEINPSAVKAASLKISSQLLKLAVIVETDRSKEN